MNTVIALVIALVIASAFAFATAVGAKLLGASPPPAWPSIVCGVAGGLWWFTRSKS
jgi:hypothetical protein